jgi:hypothetical protein
VSWAIDARTSAAQLKSRLNPRAPTLIR